MADFASLSVTPQRDTITQELRRLLPRHEGLHKAMPFGIAALDSYLPEGGLACGTLHEVVPKTEGAIAAAFGFIAAILSRLSQASPLILVRPVSGLRQYGRLS